MDLRCYGTTTPRHDGKLSVKFVDLGDFYHEWHLDELPWDAVTSVLVGDEHPDVLDPKLFEAITTRALPDSCRDQPKARVAAIAFLYLYMAMTHEDER